MGRRGRGLNDSERSLWQQVADSARPLQGASTRTETSQAALASGEASPLAAPRAAAPPAPRLSFSPAVRPAGQPSSPSIRLDLAPDPHAALDRAHPHMDRRKFESLRRGRHDPEARLDLHGMTAERAHSALTSFILGAHASGLRLVLVITGKGRPPEEGYFPMRHGVLRHNVPHWLSAPPLGPRVLQVAPAHRRHGGGGAYYVYLRRSR